MGLDAIVIANSGYTTFSGSQPLKLAIDDRPADVQTIINFVAHDGQLREPVDGADRLNWAAAPKLNGIYLTSYLKQQGFAVETIDDFCGQKDEFRRLLRRAPKAILVSTTYIYHKRALLDLAAEIRALAPHVPIIAGGPFVNLSGTLLRRSAENGASSGAGGDVFLFLEVGEEPAVDLYVASPRGESVARQALALLSAGRPLDGLPSTVRLKDGKYVFSETVEPLTEPLAPVAWDSLPDAVFRSGVVPLQASSGCPFNCAFCNFVRDRALLRVKPISEVIDELRRVAARGVRYVWFVDENFHLGKRDLAQFCRELIAARLDIRWMSYFRVDGLDGIDTSLLRDAGCIEVRLGLESADPQVLQNMNKRASPELYARVVTRLLEAGINCTCFLIFGFPGETEESVQRTIDFMRQFEARGLEGALSWSLFPFIVAPLSPVDGPEMRARFQLRGFLTEWQHATMNSAQARQYVLKAFHSISTHGCVYWEDNLDMLRGMTPERRSRLHEVRQGLAKAATLGPLEKQRLLRGFGPIFA